MMGRMFNGPVDFETAANLTAQAPALYEWDTFADKNKVRGRVRFHGQSWRAFRASGSCCLC